MCTHRTLALVIGMSAVGCARPAVAQECGDHWLPALQTQVAGVQSLFSASDTCTFDPDGNGPLPRVLVVAGSISIAGSGAVRNIAQWDGAEWSELGGGLNSIVSAVVEFEGSLIAGGYFNNAGDNPDADRVARWDGQTWSAMGTLPGFQVEDLRVLDGELYAAVNSGGNASSTLHKWNGTSWDQIGNAIPNAFLMAIERFNNQLYVGGVFQNADGDATADGIAFFNGSTWQGVGGGLVGDVYDLRVHNGALYVGGQYSDAGGVGAADSIARWTGAAWQAIGTGLNTQCMALEVLNGNIVAGGYFGNVGNPPSSNTTGIARFDGTNWLPMGAGFGPGQNYVRDLTIFNGELTAVGNIDRSGSEAFSGVAHFDGTKWLGFGGPGLGRVLAVAEFNGELVIGGQFRNAGGDADADFIARWHNGGWAPVGEAFNGTVRALMVYQDELFAAGDFTDVGDPAQADYLAKWNGTDWESVGPETFDGPVNALGRFGGSLVIAGDFTVLSSNLLLWDGADFTPQSSLSGAKFFTEAHGTLYGATEFGTQLFRLTGGSWAPVSASLGQNIKGMAAFNNQVYVTLPISNILGDPNLDFCIAWDGTQWNPTGTSPPNPGPVAVYEGRLFAGAPLEELVNGVWQSLGFPSDSGVEAVAVVNGALTLGGEFARQGGQFSPYVARFKSGDPAADCDPAWAQPFSPTVKLNGRVLATHVWHDDTDENTPGRWLIGGTFSKQGTEPLARVAVWNEGTGLFDALGAGFNGTVNALATFDHDDDPQTPDVPVAGGAFTKTGATTIGKIAWWDGTFWQPLGQGLNGTVFALALGDPDGDGPLGVSLIAGGAFTKSGTTVVNRVARWDVDTQTWHALSTGVAGKVLCLAFFDSDGPDGNPARLFAGGAFTKVGTTLASRIAWFDGDVWNAAGAGVNGAVNTLCAADPDGDGVDALYVGGAFKKSGQTALSRIARFNGASFSAIGDGLNNTVLAIESADFDGCGPDAPVILAGGTFKKSGLAPISRLAQWDGSAWTAVGGGANTTVRSLCAVSESVGDATVHALLAAGDFKTVGTGALAQKDVGLFTCPDVAPILAPGLITPCGAADVAGVPGTRRPSHPDGQVTVDDALAFIGAMIDAESPDDGPSVEEAIAFVRAYAEGCP